VIFDSDDIGVAPAKVNEAAVENRGFPDRGTGHQHLPVGPVEGSLETGGFFSSSYPSEPNSRRLLGRLSTTRITICLAVDCLEAWTTARLWDCRFDDAPERAVLWTVPHG